MRARVAAAVATAMLPLGLVATNAVGGLPVAQASSFSAAVAEVASGAVGYRVPDPAAYVRAKALAAAHVGLGGRAGHRPTGPRGTIDVQWDGLNNTQLTPSDSTGAVGPSSYIELVNPQYGIYDRTGTLIASGTLQQLTGSSSFLGDPQILWDTNDQRFYYVIDDFNNDVLLWGFSKNNNPQSAADFCKYTANYGYGTMFPDYPKLGNSPHFLLIGANIFGNSYVGSDLDWIAKGSIGPNPVSTCPPQSQFRIGKFAKVKNANGSLMWTPSPATNTEPSLTSRPEGWIVGTAFVGSGTPSNFITVYGVTSSAIGPKLTGPFVVPVTSFNVPPSAPECGSLNLLDTLDGSLEHTVASSDPLRGVNDAIWTAHAVAGGAGSQERWYEIDPLTNPPTLIQSGTVTSSSLYVWNGSISPDRVVNPRGKAFGSNMSVTFNTSSLTACPAVQDVSKVGNNAQSGFALVKQSAGPDGDHTCHPICRWGDYSGATPDPGASLSGTEGRVWHSNQWNVPNIDNNTFVWRTENYEIAP